MGQAGWLVGRSISASLPPKSVARISLFSYVRNGATGLLKKECRPIPPMIPPASTLSGSTVCARRRQSGGRKSHKASRRKTRIECNNSQDEFTHSHHDDARCVH